MVGNDFDKQLGLRLGKLREERGWSQEQLREKTGVERRETITQWENGTRKIKAEHIIPLCEAFGISADFLLGLSEDPQRTPSAVDELGLSSEAVRNIEDAKRSADNDPYFRRRHDILNGILSDRHFKIFLSYFANAEIAAEKARAAKEQSDALKKTHRLPENGDYIKEKDAYSYHKYRCIKEFGKMLDNFCKAEGLDD